jgi:NAD(P)-dependent dehydrogenase (short-subunit alcohol dehydrogenase family)
MQIDGSAALVSGGSSGLGAACVRRLAAGGSRVLIADVNREAGEKLASDLGTRVRFVATDVTNEASVRAAVETAVNEWGGLQISIQCAGIVVAERLLGKAGPHALASFSKVIGINLIGTFNVMRLTAEAMSRNQPNAGGERGVIVNTASIAAFEGQIGQIAYAASKGGVAAMTLPAARELARSGIRVMTIAPGTFDTPLLAGLPEPARVSLAEQVPFPSRLGKPEEFADLVCSILQNEMLNGSAIRLDGALRMAPK